MAERITVVADTTTTFVDVMLSRTEWMQVLSLCSKGTIDVALPEIVLLETARHWEGVAGPAAAKASELVNKVNRAVTPLRDIGIGVAYEPVPELDPPMVDRSQYTARMRERMSTIGVTTLPLPDVSHSEVLARDLARRKPFAVSGKGYRDTLVWESLKELLQGMTQNDLVYFVTDNTADYYDDGALHPDLQAEISGWPVELRLVRNLDALVQEPGVAPHVALLAKSDEELAMYLQAVTDPEEVDYEGPTVPDLVTSALVGAVDELLGEEVATDEGESGLDFTALNIPSGIDYPAITGVDVQQHTVEWDTYETYQGETLLMQASILAEVTIDGYVYKGDFHLLDKEDVAVLDWDWNDHMAHVRTVVNARLVFQMRVEAGAGVVDDTEFEVAEAV